MAKLSALESLFDTQLDCQASFLLFSTHSFYYTSSYTPVQVIIAFFCAFVDKCVDFLQLYLASNWTGGVCHIQISTLAPGSHRPLSLPLFYRH